ncbi:MAG TPA: hypothetical protein VEW46_16160 [Pyrinomonadaceae bacterium]|nr:hypothetical protein [Pyrinomonadaceae bacterium]
MKLGLSLILFLVLGLTFAARVKAEDQATKLDAAQAADKLRLQLIDVQEKEAQLQTRARQLEEDLKPENIARSLAGVGSTRPEELREFRRRQISLELDGVRNKLKILATSRERLESSLRTAEAEAYHQSAEGVAVAVAQALKAKPVAGPRWFVMAGASIGILAAVFVFAIVRKLKAT